MGNWVIQDLEEILSEMESQPLSNSGAILDRKRRLSAGKDSNIGSVLSLKGS